MLTDVRYCADTLCYFLLIRFLRRGDLLFTHAIEEASGHAGVKASSPSRLRSLISALTRTVKGWRTRSSLAMSKPEFNISRLASAAARNHLFHPAPGSQAGTCFKRGNTPTRNHPGLVASVNAFVTASPSLASEVFFASSSIP